MKKLNPRERAVLERIEQTVAATGYAPSVRDLQAALGYKSTSTVQMYLDRLLAMGYLKKEDGKSRSLRSTRVLTVQALEVLLWDGSTTDERIAYPLPADAAEHFAVREWEGGISAECAYLIVRREPPAPGERAVVLGKNGILTPEQTEEDSVILGTLVARLLLY